MRILYTLTVLMRAQSCKIAVPLTVTMLSRIWAFWTDHDEIIAEALPPRSRWCAVIRDYSIGLFSLASLAPLKSGCGDGVRCRVVRLRTHALFAGACFMESNTLDCFWAVR